MDNTKYMLHLAPDICRYVDLGSTQTIHQVLVIPRIDGYESEFGSIEVRIGNNAISSGNPPKTSGNQVCGSTPLTTSAGGIAPVLATCNLQGRYVSVQRIGATGYLTICEVQVGSHATHTGPMTMTMTMTMGSSLLRSVQPEGWHLFA